MKISTNWLKDYVNINIPLKELANRITNAGVNVESITSKRIENIVIGKILEVKDMPDSTHLHLLRVDVKDEVLDIVCGAPNVRKDLKVIVAKVGAILPGNFEIKSTTIRGYQSNGMVCALFELGIEEKTNENILKGIHEVEDNFEVGMDANVYLGLDDVVFELDLNPNRNDCLSHIGFAYEVAAVLSEEVNLPEIKFNEFDGPTIKVDVKTPNCFMYNTKIVKDITIKESPTFIKNRLISAGMRPINNVVDISNYIMLEYGQPLHFFDFDKLNGFVEVRMAKNGERITTLDKKTRTLSEKDIIITSNDEPVGIAGVMGGLDSGVTKDTKNIVIESAIFNPINVRYTSINLELRSEASTRIEKKLNSDYTVLALNRAAYLLSKYAGGKVVKKGSSFSSIKEEVKSVTLSLSDITSLLGMALSMKDVKLSLDCLQFKYKVNKDNITVVIPNRRMDIDANKADIIEEIGRIYGYDKLEGILPNGFIKEGKYENSVLLRKEVSRRLRSLGLNEVRTYTLVSEAESRLFDYENKEKIYLLRPMSEDKKVLRTSLINSLINVYNFNVSRKVKDVNIYEISNVYSKSSEEEKICILMNGTYLVNAWQNINVSVDFYLLKGIVENLLDYLGFNGRYVFSEKEVQDMHKYICAEIILDNEVVGVLGKTDPSISDVYVCELSLTKLSGKKVRSIKHKEANKYPSIVKDISFIMNNDLNSFKVEELIKKVGGKLITSINVFDVYKGSKLEVNKKAIAYKITFQDELKTLTDEEVMVVFNKIIEEVTTKLDIKLNN